MDRAPTTNNRTRTPVTAYQRMVKLLSRRDHSEKELTEKLQKAEHSPEEIAEALEVARSKKWLPDETVLAARESARLALAGKSPSQITMWLKKKGLPTKGFVIAEDDQVNEEESAYKTASKSWARLVRTAERDVEKAAKKKAAGEKRSQWGSGRVSGLEETLKLRVTRLLLSRGFSSTTARMVFNRLLSENPL